MSYRNRTGLCGLIIASTLAIASACGGLDSVNVIVTPDDGGSSGNPSGGRGGGSSGNNPGGGDTSASGAAGEVGTGGASGAPGTAGAAGEEASGGEGGQFTIPDSMPGPPTVVAVSPQDALTTADPLGTIRITFSEPLDGPSVTSDSVQVKDEAGAVVAGAVSYADAVATFKSKARLNLLGKYTVNVSTAVTDIDKTAMIRPFSSSFTVRDGVWGRSEGSLTTSTAAFDRSSALALATDGVGRAMAVWAQNTEGSTYDIYAALFTQGKGWATPAKVNTNVANCQYPNVAMNAAGNAIVGWVEYDAALGYSVQARRNIAGAWEKVTKVDAPSTPALSTYPSGVAVAITAQGDAHISWLHYIYDATTQVSYYGEYTRHVSAAGAWDASPVTFSYQIATGASQPALAFDEAGNGFATYQLAAGSPSKSSTLVFRYVASTNKWGTSSVASTAGDSVALPVAVATNPEGEAVLSWARLTGDSVYELYASHFNKAWSAPVLISSATTTIASSKTMASATWTGSSFLVAWAQSGGTPYNVYVNEYKTSWGSAAIISDGNHSATLPQLSADGRGNALAVWYQASDSASTSTVIPADIAFSRFVGAAGKWTDVKRASSAVAGYRFPQVVTLADGTALAAWQRIVQIPKNINVNGVLANEFQ